MRSFHDLRGDATLVDTGSGGLGRTYWLPDEGILGSTLVRFPDPTWAELYTDLHLEAHLWIHADYDHGASLILDVDEVTETGTDFVLMRRRPGARLGVEYASSATDTPPEDRLAVLTSTIATLVAEAATPIDQFFASLIQSRILAADICVVYSDRPRRFQIDDLHPSVAELLTWRHVRVQRETDIDEDALLAAVLADPGADEPRRAVADRYAWHDAYGEFIRLQLGIAAGERHGIHDGLALRRQRELINKHGVHWAGDVVGLVSGFRFHRGFVGEVDIPVSDFVDLLPRLREIAPIQHVNLVGPVDGLARLLDVGSFSGLVSLGLERLGLADDHAVLVADTPALGQLNWIGLGGNKIGRHGVEALAAARHLCRVPVLDLSGNPCNPVPRPGAYELDGSVTAVERPRLADELITRYGPREWLNNPVDPDTWPLPRDAYRRWA